MTLDREPRARVIWCETERELPSLRRGWRTPDPSPTREAAGLPGYALQLCVATPILDPHEPSLLKFTPVVAVDMPDEAGSSEGTSTTTCPPSSHEPLFVPPPRREKDFDQEASFAGGTKFEDARNSQRLKDTSTATQPAYSTEPCFVPPPPLEKELAQEMGSAEGASSQQSKVQASNIGSPTGETSEADEGHVLVVSVGSVGHPNSCAGACKFAKKRNRGCKDGSACLHCHLCKWTRRGSRLKGPPAAQMSKPL